MLALIKRQDALIIPVSARGSEHLFDAFAEITGFPSNQCCANWHRKQHKAALFKG